MIPHTFICTWYVRSREISSIYQTNVNICDLYIRDSIIVRDAEHTDWVLIKRIIDVNDFIFGVWCKELRQCAGFVVVHASGVPVPLIRIVTDEIRPFF